jgi:hypothetical protein
MPLNKVVLGAARDLMLGGKREGALVFFEGTAVNCGTEFSCETESKGDFQKKRSDRNDSAKTLTESGVLAFLTH